VTVVARDHPAAAEEACRNVMTRLAAASAFRTPNLRRAAGRELTLVTPHRLAVLSLEVLQDDRRPLALKEIGWRFLVQADGEALAACEALEIATGYRFGGLNEGPLVSGFVEALGQAEQLSATRGQDYEPRLLLVPALNVAALWLGQSGGTPDAFAPRDLIVPLPPSDSALRPYQAIGQEAFLAAVRRMAREVPRGGVTGG
jgi:hypothetical protein